MDALGTPIPATRRSSSDDGQLPLCLDEAPTASASARTWQQRDHALYRFFAADGALLYVGITRDPRDRFGDHRRDKPWWIEVARIDMEPHPDRDAVLCAEKAAIQAESPRYNTIHQLPAERTHPRARPRLAVTPTTAAAPPTAKEPRVLRRSTGADVPWDTVWPSDNDKGIPALLLERQADLVDVPFSRWGRESRKSRMHGTWHFYTDNAKFSAVWSRPQVVTNSACVAIVEPCFPVTAQTPYALALYQTYRKRWLARFWQDHGIRVYVDLGVAEEHAETNLIGVPRGWRAYAARGGGDPSRLDREHGLARSVAGAEPLFIVYGGGRLTKEHCQIRGWTWFPEEAEAVRAARRGQGA